jgi:carbonic anhydrase
MFFRWSIVDCRWSIVDDKESILTVHPAHKRLMEGNRRFASGKSEMDVSESRRHKLAFKQKPFAMILGCSDSRLPPEIIFDQGMGELFVVRTAGTTLDNAVIGTLELGIKELHIPFLMVLGHKRCGAVKFALDAVGENTDVESNLSHLLEQLRPSVENSHKGDGEKWENATRMHTAAVVEQLKRSPVIGNAIKTRELDIATGWYDLDTGMVEITNYNLLRQDIVTS